uniref:RING-type domain-containing protein n=1 Tax=Macrostomum lignano TaxID=282301 RepID=A0A1I8FEX8_9PLAT
VVHEEDRAGPTLGRVCRRSVSPCRLELADPSSTSTAGRRIGRNEFCGRCAAACEQGVLTRPTRSIGQRATGTTGHRRSCGGNSQRRQPDTTDNERPIIRWQFQSGDVEFPLLLHPDTAAKVAERAWPLSRRPKPWWMSSYSKKRGASQRSKLSEDPLAEEFEMLGSFYSSDQLQRGPALPLRHIPGPRFESPSRASCCALARTAASSTGLQFLPRLAELRAELQLAEVASSWLPLATGWLSWRRRERPSRCSCVLVRISRTGAVGLPAAGRRASGLVRTGRQIDSTSPMMKMLWGSNWSCQAELLGRFELEILAVDAYEREMQFKRAVQTVRFRHCGHVFCNSCGAAAFRALLEADRPDRLGCLQCSGRSSRLLSPLWCAVCSPEEFSRYEQSLLQAVTQAHVRRADLSQVLLLDSFDPYKHFKTGEEAAAAAGCSRFLLLMTIVTMKVRATKLLAEIDWLHKNCSRMSEDPLAEEFEMLGSFYSSDQLQKDLPPLRHIPGPGSNPESGLLLCAGENGGQQHRLQFLPRLVLDFPAAIGLSEADGRPSFGLSCTGRRAQVLVADWRTEDAIPEHHSSFSVTQTARSAKEVEQEILAFDADERHREFQRSFHEVPGVRVLEARHLLRDVRHCGHAFCDSCVALPRAFFLRGIRKYEQRLFDAALSTMGKLDTCPRCQATVLVDPAEARCLAHCQACYHAYCQLCRALTTATEPCQIRGSSLEQVQERRGCSGATAAVVPISPRSLLLAKLD